MPQRRGGASSRPARAASPPPKPAPKAQPPAPAPAAHPPAHAASAHPPAPAPHAPAPMSSGGPGLLGTMAASAAGSMAGSVVGHTIARTMFGGSGSSEQQAAAPAAETAAPAPMQQVEPSKNDPCYSLFQSYKDCITANKETPSRCEWAQFSLTECERDSRYSFRS